VTPDGTTTYQYGAFGELQRVVTPTQTIEYLHNANNQRVAKKINGEIVEKYLWANLTTLLAIYDKDDNLVQRFEYADQRMPIAMMQNNQKYYLHYGQVGSLRAITDTDKNIIKEVSYDTFGNILRDSNEAFKIPFGFAGGLQDNDSGLVRFGYRDYDPFTGKWTAKDPIGFSGGDSNLYGYVLGDPVNFVDPTGQWIWVWRLGKWVIATYFTYEAGKTVYDYGTKIKDALDNPKEMGTKEYYNQISEVNDASRDFGKDMTMDIMTGGQTKMAQDIAAEISDALSPEEETNESCNK